MLAAAIAVLLGASLAARAADPADPDSDADQGRAPLSQAPGAPAIAPPVLPLPPPDANSPAAGALAPLQPCPPNGTSRAAAPVSSLNPGLANLIRDRVHRRIGGDIISVCRTPFGMFEVVIDGDILYVDERANFVVAGNAFDLRTQENLTARRKEEAIRVDFRSLPFQYAVKTVRGKGTRQLVIFEDPNCPYCKRFEKDIATLGDTTIYTFLYPVLSRDPSVESDSYPRSKSVWCARDQAAAWSQLMLEGHPPASAPDSCKSPLETILELGQKLHITGTPTLLFTDGRRAPGAIPLERVEQMMAEAARTVPPQ